MVQDHSIELSEGLDGDVDSLLGEGEICQIAVHHLDLLAVLLFELLEGLDAAGHHHDIVGLRCGEKILRNSEANAWSDCEFGAPTAGWWALPREAPVTMMVLAAMFDAVESVRQGSRRVRYVCGQFKDGLGR